MPGPNMKAWGRGGRVGSPAGAMPAARTAALTKPKPVSAPVVTKPKPAARAGGATPVGGQGLVRAGGGGGGKGKKR